MKRKLVEQGSCTLMVSLPKSWGRKQCLKKGDEVNIEEQGDAIIISPALASKKKSISINLTTNTESAIRLIIINAYRSGYDNIRLSFKTEAQYKYILGTIQNYTLGFEMTRKTSEDCALENISEPSEEKFDVLFSKIFNSLTLFIQGTHERLTTKARNDYHLILMNIHKYDNFCRRIITKQRVHADTAHFYWNFLSVLIHTARELYHLNKYLDAHMVRKKESYTGLFNLMQEQISLIENAYYKKDISKIERLHELEPHILKMVYHDLKKKESPIPFHLNAALRHLYLSTSPLLGLILQEKYQGPSQPFHVKYTP